jgi:hypothetical protein
LCDGPRAARFQSVWIRSEPVVERVDVDAVLVALMDIRTELTRIRNILEEDDGSEERPDP